MAQIVVTCKTPKDPAGLDKFVAAVGAAFGSPEGNAAAGDVANFATGGADIAFFDTKDV